MAPPLGAAVVARSESRPIGFLTRERGEALAARDPQGVGAIIARADRVLRGEVSFFGYPTVVLPLLGHDYALDPITGFHWPDQQGRRLDYRSSPSDPKWIWELNRCQEIPVLVQAWLVTGETAYAEAAASVMLDWIARQSPGRGVAWTSGFEAALRAISLATAYDGLAAAPELELPLREPVLRTLWQHARWIERDPSTHSSANNHRIGELVGLLTIASLAPELPETEKRAETACNELVVEVQRQVLSDGTSAEQSFSYGLFVLDLVCLAVSLLDLTNRNVPLELTQTLARGADALWAQMGRADEPEPTYGDDDDGRALRLDGIDTREARGVASSICARLGHPAAKSVAGSMDPTSWWLFGEAGSKRFEDTEEAPRPQDALLEAARLVVLRRGESRVTFDAGPLGYRSLAAHGHADALAITVSSGQTELIVDPGTGSYFRRPEVRNAFRGTGFHPTVSVDSRDQSMQGGPFLWSRHAESWFTHVDLEGGVIAAEHNGYLALADPVRHRRVLAVLGPALIVVYDRLESSARHEMSLRWPLHPSAETRLEGAGEVRAKTEGTCFQVAFAGTVDGRVSVDRGVESPLLGWYSPRLEELRPAPLVKWESGFSGDLDVVTALCLVDESWPRLDLTVRRQGVVAEISVKRAVGSETLRIDFDDASGRVERVSSTTTRFEAEGSRESLCLWPWLRRLRLGCRLCRPWPSGRWRRHRRVEGVGYPFGHGAARRAGAR